MAILKETSIQNQLSIMSDEQNILTINKDDENITSFSRNSFPFLEIDEEGAAMLHGTAASCSVAERALSADEALNAISSSNLDQSLTISIGNLSQNVYFYQREEFNPESVTEENPEGETILVSPTMEIDFSLEDIGVPSLEAFQSAQEQIDDLITSDTEQEEKITSLTSIVGTLVDAEENHLLHSVNENNELTLLFTMGEKGNIIGSPSTGPQISYFTIDNNGSLNVCSQDLVEPENHNITSICFTESDKRLKENIHPSTTSGIELINQIELKEFDWNCKPENPHQKIGFIADELEELDSRLANGGGYDKDGNMIKKVVDNFYLQGYEVKAIQELYQMIQELKQENIELKNKISQLEK